MAYAHGSEYNESYAKRLYDLRKSNYSVHELAMELDVCLDSMYAWAKKYPEFEHAFDLCRDNNIALLKKKGRENMDNRAFNSRTHELLLSHAVRQGCRRSLSKSLRGQNAMEQCSIILDKIADGEVDYDLGSSLINVVMASLKATDAVLIREELERIKNLAQTSILNPLVAEELKRLNGEDLPGYHG